MHYILHKASAVILLEVSVAVRSTPQSYNNLKSLSEKLSELLKILETQRQNKLQDHSINIH